MGRILRQMETSARVTEILNTDQGIDQFQKLLIRVFQAAAADQDYDTQLAFLIESSDNKPVLECVDGCF